MGMVKQFYMDYCEAMHPDDYDAQDRLFEQLCDGSVQVSVEEARAKIEEYKRVILMWEKPAKAMPVEQWKGISADGAPPGTYVPNMSREDAKKWRAKLCGHKSGHPQVEIRTSRGGSQLLIIVSVQGNIKYQGRTDQCNVRISANGPLKFMFEEFEELKIAVAEAAVKLYEVANANPVD